MKSFFKKLWYALLAIFMLFIITGMISASGYPGLAGAVFLLGVPFALYKIFRSHGLLNPKMEPVIELTMEVRNSGDSLNRRTINVDDSDFAIPKKSSETFKFLSKNENINVCGYDIGGLVYIGSTSVRMYNQEPAVIDPKLPAKKGSLVEPLGYWPAYPQLNPSQRDYYLSWLANGRGETDELGYVFLYFYGFERYALRDASKDTPGIRDQILSDIVAEITRLKKLFTDNRSFDDYSTQLLDIIYVLHWPSRIKERKVTFPTKQPVAAQYAIAQLANTSPETPLDPDWALHWLLGFGPVSRTKTIREQYPVLRALFKAVYLAKTKGGIKVPVCKTKLQIWVNPASQGLTDVSQLDVSSEWCDPTGLKRPMTQLLSVHEEVMPALRSLAKAVAKKDIAAILSSWPAGVPTESLPKLNRIIEQVRDFIAKHPSPEISALGKLFGMHITDKVSAAQLKQMAAALESCGLVIVPDPLITPASLKPDHPVVVYSGQRQTESLSPEGQWVALSVQLGCMLALADGVVHAHEKTTLQRVVNAHSNAGERQYLESYLDWRLGHPPSTAGLKKQIDLLSEPQRHEVGRMLINVALADGDLPPTEIKQLEKLFVRLGLESALVTELLHKSASSTPRTTVVPTAESPQAGIILDEEALVEHAESTKEIQNVLHHIFQEGPEVSETATEAVVPDGSWHEGRLDEHHEALASWLLTQDEWSMAQITEKCQELGLLVEGALEVINDAAFDALGDSLIEIGDPVEVYRDVLPA